MIKINQEIVVQASRESVWKFLTDAAQVAECLPGVKSFEPVGENVYQAQVSIKIGPIKPSVVGKATYLEMKPQESMRIHLAGKDKITSSKLESTMEINLADGDDGAVLIRVQGDVDVLGSLSKFGQGVADKKGREISAKFAESMQTRLSELAGG
jgi:uncharacterized protein